VRLVATRKQSQVRFAPPAGTVDSGAAGRHWEPEATSAARFGENANDVDG
jgi:hypothetical protein